MSFYEITARQDYAGYEPDKINGHISNEAIGESYRCKEVSLVEYLGDPPRKPAKRGCFHTSAYGSFVRSDALSIFISASKHKIITNPTSIIGRGGEDFYQIWVANFVDCLDIKRTIASPASGKNKNKIGVIKKPVFDESKWDGSDLFVVPQDPSYCLFCSERFLEQWKNSKYKGIEFSRYLMDPDAIEC